MDGERRQGGQANVRAQVLRKVNTGLKGRNCYNFSLLCSTGEEAPVREPEYIYIGYNKKEGRNGMDLR